jgi:two-component system, OmpR family, response regulator
VPDNRILLVEDEPTTREILTYVLREEGYAVDSVGSAGAATTCLEAIPYALVIADWFLPDGNGIVVADAAAELGAKTLIISDLVFQLPGGVAGAHQLLPKRVGATEIVAAVQRMIGKPMVEPECPERRNGVP